MVPPRTPSIESGPVPPTRPPAAGLWGARGEPTTTSTNAHHLCTTLCAGGPILSEGQEWHAAGAFHPLPCRGRGVTRV